jgi:hypothetical protein
MSFGVCQDCGGTSKIHRHHEDMQHGAVDPDAIAVLCPRCHMAAHGRADQGTGARSDHLRWLGLQCNRDTRRPRKDRALPVAEYDAWLRRELAACVAGGRHDRQVAPTAT